MTPLPSLYTNQAAVSVMLALDYAAADMFWALTASAR
jgi:hypothetical protein